MASHDDNRPNVVVILTDDQGYWAMGCAGNGEIHTPNLDRLAATGVRFENFFCASPVCSPARASLLTGMIPSQHGVHDWIRAGNLDSDRYREVQNRPDRAIEYLEGLSAYTDVLSTHGYTCGLSGKWHLGDSSRPQRGFSSWYAFPTGGGDYNNPLMFRDGELRREVGYLTDRITDGGLRFLDAYAGDDAPFYLSVHYTAPHSPWERGQHPEAIVTRYEDCPFETCPDVGVHPWQVNSAPRGTGAKRRELLQGYYAAITALDAGVGRILDRLEALGLREHTLVFFTSDNGMNMGHHGIWGKGNGTFPQNMYDTSVKVPAIISRPGHVPQGVVRDHLLSHYDFMPTLLDYLGLEQPGTDRLPGQSFALLLRGEPLPERERVVVCDEYGPVRMIRTRAWKYVHRYPYGPHELYDLAHDPGEAHNRVDDPDQREVVEEMKAQLDAWFVRYADPARDGAREPVTGMGQVERVGPAGRGRTAFFGDWWRIDADGNRLDPAR